jgi:hypothetical protein
MRLIILATCCCVLLMARCEFAWGQDAVKPVEVTLCDLYQHPEQYQGRMVKVRGGSVGSLRIEDMLHDSSAKPCRGYMRIVVVFPDQAQTGPSPQLVEDESYKKLAETLRHYEAVHIDATYEGRFDAAFTWRDHKKIRLGQGKEDGYGKKHEYDGRIVLHQVSNVWTQPLPRK